MDTFHICLLSNLRTTVLTYRLIETLNSIFGYPWMRVRVYAMSSVHIPLITGPIANNPFWLGSDVEVNFPAWRLSVFFLLWLSEDGHLNSQSMYQCFICFCPYEACFRFVFMRWLIWCCSGTAFIVFQAKAQLYLFNYWRQSCIW